MEPFWGFHFWDPLGGLGSAPLRTAEVYRTPDTGPVAQGNLYNDGHLLGPGSNHQNGLETGLPAPQKVDSKSWRKTQKKLPRKAIMPTCSWGSGWSLGLSALHVWIPCLQADRAFGRDLLLGFRA